MRDGLRRRFYGNIEMQDPKEENITAIRNNFLRRERQQPLPRLQLQLTWQRPAAQSARGTWSA
jgi:hypothetical protein